MNNLTTRIRSVHSLKATTRRVVVTGLGAVTPLGNSAKESWNKLIKGESGIRKLEDPGFEGLPSRVAARVDRSSLQIDTVFSKKELRSMSSATVLALLATSEALESAKLNQISEDIKDRIGVCIGMGMIDLSDVYTSYKTLTDGYNRLSPYFVPRILPNMAGGNVSIKYGFRGPLHSVSTACATGAHAIGDAFRFIQHNDADIMICGCGESCIDPLSIAGFCRLRALSTNFNDDPSRASRPFDKDRDGFVMGEGSAILILEELEHAKRRGAEIYAEILGYGLSGDAHHLTSPSEDGKGAVSVMKRTIQNAGLTTDDISYVNAHATSTPAGDKIEATAIRTVFGQHTNDVLVSSTKGAHGHLLGASGNLEALFVVMACKSHTLPPSINLDTLGNGIDLNIIQKAQEWVTKSRRIAVKNSFGFGGTNACLCIGEFVEETK